MFSTLMILAGVWLLLDGYPIFGSIIILLSIFNLLTEIFEK